MSFKTNIKSICPQIESNISEKDKLIYAIHKLVLYQKLAPKDITRKPISRTLDA
jgi:hypothetical protein